MLFLVYSHNIGYKALRSGTLPLVYERRNSSSASLMDAIRMGSCRSINSAWNCHSPHFVPAQDELVDYIVYAAVKSVMPTRA